ncbi:hypothetical protein ACFFMN_29695 [Planobispora siamensis]|uniref:Uncharacterized protein n=1 Tax=Planobispora siamensis TaxID=936338 RepID=A0A8J3WID1_9ACTN|nr:hypothetical protein [Planobispora siamensis]GIH91639.1 hypothetical protein Psi01_22690 [Planobispora siamensis]
MGKVSGPGGPQTFTFSSPQRGRYVLLWFTELPGSGNRFRAQVNGVRMTAAN